MQVLIHLKTKSWGTVLQKYIRLSARNKMLLRVLEFTVMNFSALRTLWFLFKTHRGKAE